MLLRGAAPMQNVRKPLVFHLSHSLWTSPPKEGCQSARGKAVFEGFYQPRAPPAMIARDIRRVNERILTTPSEGD